MAGYSARQSPYTTGDTISAADTNDEFDTILTAFGTSGHTHDGTAGNGGTVSITSLPANVTVADDIKLYFGTGNDAYIEYDEDGTDTWDFSPPAGGMKILDDKKLAFGTGSDWTIEYDEDCDDDLVFTGSDMSIESSTSAKPVIQLLNTNADANGATFKFNKNGSSPASSDVIGNIDFVSEDAGNAVTTFGRIQGTITDVTAGGEEGSIGFHVAENDGTLTKGMEIKGIGSDGNITVDISTHDGAAGGLMLGGTLVTSSATELNLLDGVSSIPALTGSTNNTIVTVTGSNAIAGEATFTYDGSDLKILETTNDGSPSFTIGSADAESGKIQAV